MIELLAENPVVTIVGATTLNLAAIIGAVVFGIRQEGRINKHDTLFEERDRQHVEDVKRFADAAQATDRRVERLETLLLNRVVIVREDPRA